MHIRAMILTITAAFGVGSVRADAKDSSMKQIHEVSFDWHGTGKPDTFEFFLPGDWNDPGQYLSLKMTFSHGVQCEINLDAGLPSESLFMNLNLVESKFVAFLKDSHSPWPIMMLRNWSGGSNGDEVKLFRLPSAKDCPVEFWSQSFFLEDVQNIKGNVRFLGHMGAESVGNQLFTYDPLLVYQIQSKTAGKVTVGLDLELSKSMNEKRNYPWVGPTAEKDQVVFYPKPRLIRQTDISKIPASERGPGR